MWRNVNSVVEDVSVSTSALTGAFHSISKFDSFDLIWLFFKRRLFEFQLKFKNCNFLTQQRIFFVVFSLRNKNNRNLLAISNKKDLVISGKESMYFGQYGTTAARAAVSGTRSLFFFIQLWFLGLLDLIVSGAHPEF